MSELRGGCLCGAIRYRAGAVQDAGYCHCERCRRWSGAPVTAWALVAAESFRVERGAPASHGARRFCRDCGSSLWHEAGGGGGVITLCTGSLDDANAAALEPRIHRFIEGHVAWLRLHDLLPFVEGGALTPPEERHFIRGLAPDPAVTRASALAFREVTMENLGEVLFADVTGAQRRFVAHNAISLAQGLMAGDAWIRAICAGAGDGGPGTVVGFAMCATMKEDALGLPMAGDPEIWRFMIDARYQRLGFGGRALGMLVDELSRWPGARHIWLSCVPGAGSPYPLYRRFGFVDTGQVFDGEIVMRLPLPAPPR